MKTVMSGINKVYDGFNKINEWFIIFLMALMCLDLLAQVVCRYVFSYPLTWSEELAPIFSCGWRCWGLPGAGGDISMCG